MIRRARFTRATPLPYVPPGGGGQLDPGLRAGPGAVGYLGTQGELTVINPGDPLTGPLAGGSWDGDALTLGGADRNLDQYRFNCQVLLTGSDPTMTNCHVVVGLGMNLGVYHTGAGTFTVEDCTVTRDPAAQTGDIPIHLIASDLALVARRCDVSGGGDQVHFTGPGSLLSQLCVHDQAFIDVEQHADGAQVFKGAAAGSYTVEHCYFDSSGAEGTALVANSCITQGPAPATTTGTELMTPTLNNCYFNGGQHMVRLDGDLTGIVVTNNDFGPDFDEADEVFVRVPANVATWSNNRDSGGNLIPQP